MGLVFSLGPVGMDQLCSAWCWLILLSWGQRIQDGATHVWCLGVSCWLVLFSSLPCGFFFFPHSLSLPSILTIPFWKLVFWLLKMRGESNTRSLKTQAQAQNHVSSLLPHSVGEWSHKATRVRKGKWTTPVDERLLCRHRHRRNYMWLSCKLLIQYSAFSFLLQCSAFSRNFLWCQPVLYHRLPPIFKYF